MRTAEGFAAAYIHEEEEQHGPDVPSWPAPMADEAFYGTAGRFVRLVAPHTEADPHLLLVNFLTYCGVLMGRSRYLFVGGGCHYPNLFIAAVGPTATGRKGTAFGPIDRMMHPRQLHGLSSGEGLIWAVRDPVPAQGKRKVADVGVDDKRLLVKVSEFQGAMSVMRREGNPLSAVLRCAHDGIDLETPNKTSAAKATAPHIGMIGNVTKDELLRLITAHDASNGLLNRFLWICSRRSKQLPQGGRLHEVMSNGHWHELEERINRFCFPGKDERIYLDDEAQEIWGYDDQPGGLYRELTKGGDGLLAEATARGHVYVLRMALIYSRLDGSCCIRREHLDAAHAIWRYAYDSAKFVFGDRAGDPVADQIYQALQQAGGAGMTRTDMRDLFGRHQPTERIDVALRTLAATGRVRMQRENTPGRSVEKWYAI
jgi:hypothetical protein